MSWKCLSGNSFQYDLVIKSREDMVVGQKSFDDQFNEAWEKLGEDWFAHQWYELQRSRMLLGKLRTLREMGIFCPRIKGKIAYSDMLRRETIRHTKTQGIQNYRKIAEYFQCEQCTGERKPAGMLEAGYAISKMKLLIQRYRCKKEVQSIDIAEIKNEWIRNYFNITNEDLAA
jgi:hypothetical protein